jgi:hypothetical protein
MSGVVFINYRHSPGMAGRLFDRPVQDFSNDSSSTSIAFRPTEISLPISGSRWRPAMRSLRLSRLTGRASRINGEHKEAAEQIKNFVRPEIEAMLYRLSMDRNDDPYSGAPSDR